MRILQIGKYYAPARGGMETVLRNMTEGLLAAGHEVRVLVAGDARRTSREDLPGSAGGLIRAGVLGTWSSQPLALGLPRLLRWEIARFQPDIVHLHVPNPLACWSWLQVARSGRGRRPLLAIWHHADILRQRLGGPLVAPLVRRCLGYAAGVCVSSETWRATSSELAAWRDRVRVIPFGIDPEPFLARTPAGGGPFVFIGRLVPYKGLMVLLEALAGLPAAELDIVGTGPQHRVLARRCAQSDLRGRVRLRGEVPDTALPALLAASRALVLPSQDRSETFGLVLLEAMAAGLPLVTSDLPTGVRELNRPGQNGWLAAPGDVLDLRRQLAAVLADPAEARRRGLAGRERVTRDFTRVRMAADLTAWYTELLDSRGTGTAGAPAG